MRHCLAVLVAMLRLAALVVALRLVAQADRQADRHGALLARQAALADRLVAQGSVGGPSAQVARALL